MPTHVDDPAPTGQLASLVGAVMSEQAASAAETMTVAAISRRRRIM
ncbi:MAG: hypothetical protein ACJ79J_09135 [Gemmatimonadaceae bacterium]